MRNFYVKISKIQYVSPNQTGYSIFLGTVCKKIKKTGELKPTPEKVSCTGTFLSLYPGDILELTAELWEHPKYGEQYNVLSYHQVQPGSIESIQKFLIARGKGLGLSKAKTLTDAYGLDTISRIINDPTALDIIRLTTQTKDELRKILSINQAFEDILILLRSHGIDPIYAMSLYKEYGELTITKLTSNPYLPFLSGLWPFSISDKIHAQLGYGPNTENRVYACIYGAILWDATSGGNLCMEPSQLKKITYAFLAQARSSYNKDYLFSDECFSDVLNKLLDQGKITIDPVYESIYLCNNLANEQRITSELIRLMQSPKRYALQGQAIDQFLADYEVQTKLNLAIQQKNAVHMALTSPVSVITGGPGTGKTHTIRTIIAALKKLCPDASIQVCAPTGKAAIRAEEMSGMPASTIHRLLRLFQRDKELGDEELECDVLIADEYSMVDAYLCGRLFRSAAGFTRIIIVGDCDQLPSVGPGLVLRDFISCGKIPVTKLSQVFRQAKKSRIVKNANRIIQANGTDPIKLSIAKNPNEDFYFLEAESVSGIRNLIQKSVYKLRKKYRLGIGDVQILSPIRKTDLGTESLNYLFQELFCPRNSTPTIQLGEKEFRLGDKVIHTKNNSELDVYNGEVGHIQSLNYMSDNMLSVEYPDGKVIDYSLAMLDDLDLAYSLTVHKSQGSEFPAVIIPVHESILYGMNKNVLYTALTRAKRIVILIGTRKAVGTAIRDQKSISDRRSNLVDRLSSIL